MKLPRGILKYGLYVLMGAWMFVLGVVVGRGTSPVTFDTSSFQERLKVIVGKIPEQAPATEKVDLDFYEALNKPVPQDTGLLAPPEKKEREKTGGKSLSKDDTSGEEAGPDGEKIPVKFSRKRATFKETVSASGPGAKDTDGTATPDRPPSKEAVGKKAPAPKPASPDTGVTASETGGQYTIQVAAYRAFKDAVTQMSLLEKKGFSSYKTKAEANGTTWYRVRTGSFKDFSSAQAELNRLKQAKINGMIIKKEDQ